MEKLNFSVEAFELLRRAESDPEAAASAMTLAARYIRDGLPLPMGLREWIVNALGDAALQPAKFRAKSLTDALNLTSKNRRPAGDWLLIGGEIDELVIDGETVSKAVKAITDKHNIDRRTAKRYFDRYRKAKATHDAIE